MPRAWFEVPYEGEEHGPVVSRTLALDHFTQEIEAAGGYWSESEIDAGKLDGPDFGKAVVLVRAPDTLLAKISGEFTLLDDPFVVWKPERGHPHLREKADTRPLKDVERDVLTPQRLSNLKKRRDEIVGRVEQEGYVRLERSSWPDDARLLAMLKDVGVSQDKASFGTFPVSGTPIDTYTRANSSDLGTTWTPLSTFAACAISGGEGTASPNNYAGEYYNANTYGPNCDAWLRWRVTPSNESMGPFLRVNTTSVTGYHLHCTDSLIKIYRLNSNISETKLGADISQPISNSIYVGIEAIGSTISAYFSNTSTSGFGLSGSRTDATYSSSGVIGVFPWWFDAKWDDFGGGTVAGTSKTVTAEEATLTLAASLTGASITGFPAVDNISLFCPYPAVTKTAGIHKSIYPGPAVLSFITGQEPELEVLDFPFANVRIGSAT